MMMRMMVLRRMIQSGAHWTLTATTIAAFAAISTFSNLARADAATAPPASAPTPAPPPPEYVCARAAQPPAIDGRLDDPAWNAAGWTSTFVDIATAGKVPLQTRAKLLWDDSNLYIAAELREPHLRAQIDQRDEWVFHENAFEIFIDPDGDNHNYAEIEINALNTVCDLSLDKPYRDGGKSDVFWDVRDMRSAVRLDGTLNDAGDLDKGWTVEIAIPWHALAERRPGAGAGAPAEGSQWRINLARVEHPPQITDGQYRRARGIQYWCWSPQMENNLHAPERWGVVQFSPDARTPFKADPVISATRDLLMRIYHAQAEYRREHTEWTTRLEDLQKRIGPIPSQVVETKLFTTPQGWEATAAVRTPDGLQMWHVRQDSKLWRE